MLAIKFKRVGKKHQASFRVVVTEKRSKIDGRSVDDLGWMNPHADTFEVKEEKAKHWLSVGAQPTPSVHNLLVKAGIVEGPKIAVHAKSKKKPEEAAPAAPAAAGGSAPTAAAESVAAETKEEVPAPEPAKEEVKEEAPKEETPKEEAAPPAAPEEAEKPAA